MSIPIIVMKSTKRKKGWSVTTPRISPEQDTIIQEVINRPVFKSNLLRTTPVSTREIGDNTFDIHKESHVNYQPGKSLIAKRIPEMQLEDHVWFQLQ